MPSVSSITIDCARGSSVRVRSSATPIRATGPAMRAHRTYHTYGLRPSEMTGSTQDPVPLQVECARRRNRGILCAYFSPRPKPSPSQYSRACSSSASYLPTAPRRKGASHLLSCLRPSSAEYVPAYDGIQVHVNSRPDPSHPITQTRRQWRAPATASFLPSVASLDWRGSKLRHRQGIGQPGLFRRRACRS